MEDLQRELEGAQQRARHHWFQDGLTEISAGLAFVLVGGYFFALHTVQARLMGFAFPFLVFALAWGGRRLLGFAKARYVYPRSGYVSFRRRAGMRRVSAALACVIGFVVTLLLARAPGSIHWLPAFEGLLVAAALLVLGRRTGTLRFPVEGLICAGVGLTLSVRPLDENIGAALVFAAIGLVTTTGGALAFVSFLRHAPPRELS